MKKTTLAPSVTQRDPKGRKFLDVTGAAYDKAALNEAEAQRVNNTPGLAEHVAKFIEANRYTDKFKDEEVSSNFGYPSEHTLLGVEDQIAILRHHFPQLNPDSAIRYMREVYPKLELPGWVEGPFAIIRQGALCAVYGDEIAMLLEAIKSTRTDGFYNWCGKNLGEDYLQRTDRAKHYLEQLRLAQPGDIQIVPGQLGFRHRGRSTRRACEIMVETPDEVGFGALEGGSVTLTHPKRFVRWEQLHMDLPGDKYAPDARGDFSYAPYFDRYDDELEFDACDVDNAREQFGSASWLFPQQ